MSQGLSTRNEIICGDCLQVLPTLPRAKLVFADPQDNLGVKYEGVKDTISNSEYLFWLLTVLEQGARHADIFWFSFYYAYLGEVLRHCNWSAEVNDWRLILWRFTFGQHRHTDCGNGFRPMVRVKKKGAPIYPDEIRVPSKRIELGDKRADPRGRVPDDVWEFSRVCGNFKEKRKWHKNQHPEALIERVLKMCCKQGDLVIDLFAGTGTVHRVAKRLGLNSYSIDISQYYCDKIKEEDES